MMTSIMGILIAPIICFLVFVAPIWVILHYRHKGKAVQDLGTADQGKIDQMQKLAKKMEERIITLESILDSEHPDWRNLL